MVDQLHFVSYDPNTIRKTNRIDRQVECQQCHERFDSTQELRNHIGGYLVGIHGPSKNRCQQANVARNPATACEDDGSSYASAKPIKPDDIQ